MPQTIATYHDLVRADALAMLTGDAGTVLDFGGGVGATAAAMREAGRADKVVLLDQVADKALSGIDHAIALDLNDGEQVRAALDNAGPFDTILCLDVLEHLIDPWAVIALLETALKPGGTMLLSLPNASYHGVVMPLILRGRFDYSDAGVMDRTHLRWFTKATMVELGTRGELALDRIEANITGRRDNLLNTVTLGLFERFFARQYRVKLSKSGT
jgi:2-polyprenyl-3-methyl-5-hydroxy-6-metoxy-1,4-benzoquinol methylase